MVPVAVTHEEVAALGAQPDGHEADIHLQEVSKRFGDTLAVDRLTLSIGRGSFYAMLGPSGCGKTTTLRMIGGFEDPTDGRVFLARALVNRPRALLLDEPLGALDLRLRKQLQIELKRIQREVGITFVHVTHDQEEAMTMADEIAVMTDGRIEQAGSATELYETPATEFVANFLGNSNLIDGTLHSRNGSV